MNQQAFPVATRRRLLTALAAGAASVALPVRAATALPRVEVYKSPTCGCCGAWVDHLKAAGFAVQVHEVDDTAVVRRRLGLPEKFGSCHTGLVGGYVVEGHVPAAEVRRLLAARPAAIGLAVPGMPVGSPGMEYGDRRDRYEVLLVDRQGRASVYARYAGLVAEGAAPRSAGAAPQSEGEVRKVDLAQGKVTLRHGPLVNLEMPPMTMVFKAADPALLEGLSVGDKVRFTAEKVNGVYTVTVIERAR